MFLFIFYITSVCPLSSQSFYPEIRILSKESDPYFLQLQDEIAFFYKTPKDELLNLDLLIYSFKIDSSFNIFQIAAILNLPYESITTLNNISNPSDLKIGDYILIPSQPGIFIPENPISEYHKLLKETDRSGKPNKKLYINNRNLIIKYNFFPGESLNSNERSAFLQKQFSFPAQFSKVSSFYGYRIHPFTGKWSFHNGIDMKMDSNTKVYASFKGKVKETGYSEIYGYYIILTHQSGFESMYGHLNSLIVTQGQKIYTGELIALSGNTGLSSGPHLHFEIRKNGKSVDPLLYLQKGKSYAKE